MIWTVYAEEPLINDLEIPDEEVEEALIEQFNHERDQAVKQIKAARRILREQRGHES